MSEKITVKIGRKLYLLFKKRDIQSFLIIGFCIVLLIFSSSVIVLHLELKSNHEVPIDSVFDAVWWAIATITTVGYGDVVPQSFWGRIVGIFLILFGFVLFSLFTGIITSTMIESRLKGAKGLKQIKLKNHIVVCGWNQTGYSMLKAISQETDNSIQIIIVNDFTEEVFHEIESKAPNVKLKFVRGDMTQTDILNRANVRVAGQVYVLADESLGIKAADDRSVIVANGIRFISSKVPITVQLLNENSKNHLKRINIDNIILYNEIGGYLMANNIQQSNYIKLFSSLLSNSSHKFKTETIPTNYVGKPYKELVNYYYQERKSVLIGIITEEPQLELSDIFSDNSDAIDEFIRTTLERSMGNTDEHKENIKLNPDGDYVIKSYDFAMLLC
ncbi:MAG: ion channel [Candidatus Cloacimonetes bacterium]|nr:ion channel [Candidatus Cloacimonadota bacterium]